MDTLRSKRYYKINEISRLFGIGQDSLRYYERIGVLAPERAANGYRMYTLNDMYKLSLIKDLRGLGFTMAQIKAYLDDQRIDKTMAMLHDEVRLLSEQIERLEGQRATLRRRIELIEEAAAAVTDTFALVPMAERRCVRLSARSARAEEMDFLIQKLQSEHAQQITAVGNLDIGAQISVDDALAGRESRYESVFFVLEQAGAACDLILPAGTYLTYWYRGGYRRCPEVLAAALAYLDEHGLAPAGTPFEMYEIDNRDTVVEDEYLTRFEVLVARA